jgi:hypothetical protein
MSNQCSRAQYLNGALVGLSGALVLLLVDLVTSSVESTGGTVGERVLAGDVALSLLLVALLGGLSRLALDGLGDVVGGVLDRVDGLADDAVVGVVGVGSRHFECLRWLVGLVWRKCNVIEELKACCVMEGSNRGLGMRVFM